MDDVSRKLSVFWVQIGFKVDYPDNWTSDRISIVYSIVLIKLEAFLNVLLLL